MSNCKHCGKPESAHHAFEPLPGNCQCDPFAWRSPDDIPAVCAEYTAAGDAEKLCVHCDHMAACHKGAA